MNALQFHLKTEDHLDIAAEESRMEMIELTKAACALMTANSSLAPKDAVGDVFQVYLNVIRMFGRENRHC